MTPLEAKLKRIIAIDGPMPVAQYMTLCLTDPLHGYYVTRDPIGAGGDFTTAPEISQMFGELIGLWAVTVWQQLGAPEGVHLVELGPGRGTLMADALRAARLVPGFLAAVSVDLVENSPVLRRRQRAALEGFEVKPVWHEHFAQIAHAPLIVIANEFFDAMPVHQAVRTPDGWHERMVGLDRDGSLTFALHPEPLAGFSALLQPSLRHASVGAIREWRSSESIAEIARRVVQTRGAALIIDYGEAQSSLGDTLQAVGRHRHAGVLDTPGEVDLTAHVDFAALGRAAAAAGARVCGPLTQRAFLTRLGIEMRAARLKASAPTRAPQIDAGLLRLTAGGTDGMGDLFKVLAVCDPQLGAVPGIEEGC
jgi:NADH dehydrogenase [ubiquinone] 1 alpha subcomplex assembly factor 7